jgi:arginase
VCFASAGWPPLFDTDLSAGLREALPRLNRQHVAAPGCAGWSLCIYNPELDPDRSDADRIISHIARVSPALVNGSLPTS